MRKWQEKRFPIKARGDSPYERTHRKMFEAVVEQIEIRPQAFMILRYATYKSDSRSAEAGSLRASKVIISSRPANNDCMPCLCAGVKFEVSPLSISARKDVKN